MTPGNPVANRRIDALPPVPNPTLAHLMRLVVGELAHDVEHAITHNDPDCAECRRVEAAFKSALGWKFGMRLE